MLKKKTILKVNNVYTANAFQSSGEVFIGAGSETEPDVQLYSFSNEQTVRVDGCIGGMMSFIPVPGHTGSYVTIQGLFPPFLGKDAGLFLHQRKDTDWLCTKVLELPFAHRCEFISHEGIAYLVAATVSEYKENPADWSNPGELHLIALDQPGNLPWKSAIIDSGITRNHGMTRTFIDGKEHICISGAEGIFKIVPGKGDKWTLEPVFRKEVSEMTFIDLDGDGINELITIEPFHGNSLNMYKREENGWHMLFSDSLSFGHGLSSGLFSGQPVVVSGNRSGSYALETFTVSNLLKGIVNREVIEENAGPTQTQVFSFNSVDYILSANQRKNEVALYSGSPA